MSDQDLRAIGSHDRGRPTPVRRGRNVIAVIGIDNYIHWRKLNNAVRDAAGVRDFFVTSLGFQEVVPPLYNADATLEAINSLVLDQLRPELKPDDTLILFFAGHGHTETTTLGETEIQTGYLIPCGGRLPEERRFGGYLNLDSFLKDVARLPARHVMVILDACYSGFALGQTVTVLRDHERYTDDLDRRVSRHVITSAMHDQPALDNGPVPGHSLFTGALIEALQSGRADPDHRGFVTGSELALYVQKAVLGYAQERKVEQTPDYGAFEYHQRGELIIALRGETQNRNQARDCLDIARHVETLGRFTGDRKRFSFAATQYREAIRFAGLSKMAFPEAGLGLGRALLAGGDSSGAIKALSELIETEGEHSPPESRFYLGMAYASQKKYAEAAGMLATWLEKSGDHENGGWVRDYVGWLRKAVQRPGGRRLALLIGIDHYSLREAFTQKGCVNDVKKLMLPALTRSCGFQADDIITLTDQDATLQNVRTELEKLATTPAPEDAILVHFSGHSVPSSQPEYFGKNNETENVYLILHDTHNQPGHLTGGISAVELHRYMQAIPAGHKTLVLDTHANHELIELAKKEGTYALIVASDTAETAYEWHTLVDGQDIPCGMLTGALYQSLEKAGDSASLTYADWFIPAIEIASQASAGPGYHLRQTPYFVGLLERRPFGGEDPYLSAFEFVQRGNWPERNVVQLEKQYQLFCHLITSPFPQAYYAFGRAFLSHRALEFAMEALQGAINQSPSGYPEAEIAKARVMVLLGDYLSSRETLEKVVPPSKGNLQKELEKLVESLGRLTNFRRNVVLVFTEASLDSIERSGGSPNDVVNKLALRLPILKKDLQEKYGVRSEDITMICRPEATRETIMSKLKEIVEESAGGTWLFFILSPGTKDPKGSSWILETADDENTFDLTSGIPLEELKQFAQKSNRLFIWVQIMRLYR